MSNIRSWKHIRSQTHQHSPYLHIEDTEFELPTGERQIFSLIHPKLRVVSVLALTSDLRVVLARQFRPGPQKILDELPGGDAEGVESFELAARRELQEETGYVPAKIVSLGRFFEGAYSRIERHGFLALGCERKKDQSLDPTEFIEVVLKPLPEFISQIRSGLCTDCEVAWSGLWEAGLIAPKA